MVNSRVVKALKTMQIQLHEYIQDGPLLMCLQNVSYGHIHFTCSQKFRSCAGSCYGTIGEIRMIPSSMAVPD